MDGLELLTDQHRTLNRLVSELLACAPGERGERMLVLANALNQHTILEVTYFYPALRREGGEVAVSDALEAHEAVKYQLERVCAVASEGFEACVRTLQQRLQAHLQEEEAQLFPRARQRLTLEQLEVLGVEMRSALRLWEAYDPAEAAESSA